MPFILHKPEVHTIEELQVFISKYFDFLIIATINYVYVISLNIQTLLFL